MKICKKCNIELIPGENITPSMFKNYDYICKPCNANKSRVWKEKNKESYKVYSQDYYIINKEILKQKRNTWKYAKPGVYGIFENKICLYVGESTQIRTRIPNHKSLIKNPKAKTLHKDLYDNLRQHKNIEFYILEETPNHKEREQYYINKLKPLYNA